jgi:hypothetical protein
MALAPSAQPLLEMPLDDAGLAPLELVSRDESPRAPATGFAAEPSSFSPLGPAALETAAAGSLSVGQLEAIIRAQSQEIIEEAVRRIVPDIASELIKKELERLLAEQGEWGQ